MKTTVVWLNLDEESIVRHYWDQGILELLFDEKIWRLRRDYQHVEARTIEDIPTDTGAVVVLPARFHVNRIDEVNACLARLDWVVLILTSDEESLFPFEFIDHPRIRLYVMTPDVRRRFDEGVRLLGEGFASDTPEILRGADMDRREVDVGFWGQITHDRRETFGTAFRDLGNHAFQNITGLFTEAFAAGYPRDEYLRMMANTKIAPAPAGPGTADSFRFFEALEAGCVPIADARAPGDPEGYWDLLFAGHGPLPFPVLDDWTQLAEVAGEACVEWTANANRCQAWWQQYKRNLVLQLEADIDEISDTVPDWTLADLVTVIVPTSPIPSHPSTSMIHETLDSIQERLPGCEVIVVFDGVREEQKNRRADYQEYTRKLLRSFNFERENVTPIVLDEHGHQANATRAALNMVDTPLVLFVEHDTPLVGEIPFDALARVVLAGEANMIRLHHEANVLEPHRHLMVDDTPREVLGVPLLGTVQWSQRPHLASTAFYRHLIGRYFGRESRTMIEDVMHSVLQVAAAEGGWGMFRVFLYAPDGDMKRSTHLDGRGDDPKYDDRFVIEYDGETPAWAPRSTSDRAKDDAKQPGEADE